MSLSVESLPIRVRALLASRGADVSNLRNNRILALLPSALSELSSTVLQSPNPAKRHLLRKAFPIIAVDGEVDLTAALTDTEPLLLDGIRQSTITFNDVAYPAQFKADRSSLSYPASTEFIYWTLEGTKLLVVEFDGLGTFAGIGQIRNAPYVPILTNAVVQSNLDDELVEIVARMASVRERAA